MLTSMAASEATRMIPTKKLQRSTLVLFGLHSVLKTERESTSIPAFSTSFEKWRALTTPDLPPFLSNQSWLVDALYRQQVHAAYPKSPPLLCSPQFLIQNLRNQMYFRTKNFFKIFKIFQDFNAVTKSQTPLGTHPHTLLPSVQFSRSVVSDSLRPHE